MTVQTSEFTPHPIPDGITMVGSLDNFECGAL